MVRIFGGGICHFLALKYGKKPEDYTIFTTSNLMIGSRKVLVTYVRTLTLTSVVRSLNASKSELSGEPSTSQLSFLVEKLGPNYWISSEISKIIDFEC